MRCQLMYLAGLLGTSEVLLADDAPVLLHEGELHQTEPVDVVSGAIMLQKPLPVLSHLTADAAAVVPTSTFIEIEIRYHHRWRWHRNTL